MLLRLFVTLVVLVGILVGALALVLPRDQIVHLIVFRDFFDVSLPILAFGALIKYLCTCHGKKGCGNMSCKSCGSSCSPCKCGQKSCSACNPKI